MAQKYYAETLDQDPTCALALGWLGTIYAQNKEYVKAQILLEKAIAIDGSVDFQLNYANLLYDTRRHKEAIRGYSEVLKKREDPMCLSNLAACHNEILEFAEGLSCSERALRLGPGQPDALLNHGNALAGLMRYDEALASYNQALELAPDYAEAWSNRGNTLRDLRRYEESLDSCDRAIRIKPNYAEAWNNRGNALNDLSRHGDALTSYERALELVPDYAEAWSNRGAALNSLKRYEEALTSYERALELKPDYAEAWSNRGNTLRDLRRYDESLDSCDRAIRIKPNYAEAWNNRGATLNGLKRHEEALTSYERALELKPDYAEAWSNRGNALNDLKRHEEALASYDGSIKLKPDADYVLGDLIHTQMKICDWAVLHERCQTLEKRLLNGERASTPFVVLGLFDKPQLQKRCAELYAERALGFTSPLAAIARRPRRDKIRIGYFSMDFREHPVSHLIAELIELHDRRRFEVFGFSFGINTRDPMRQRLEKSFDKFLDVKDLSDTQITELSRELEIDIALDLGGHTKDSRPQIFTERAAPIQISYLGYPGTWGAHCMDYLIGDKVVITDSNREHFFEKIIFLPNQFQVNPSYRPIASSQKSRNDYGLPEKSFVFCCFNNNWKIISSVFYQWLRILQKVPQSVLWLYVDNPTSATNLREEAIKHGLSPERVIFAGSVTREKYLEQYKFADLFLDTRPYNAGTTASDALWAGLPVLTQVGESFASRMAASLLANIGIAELITHTDEEYEALAVALASNPEKLANIKAMLTNNRLKKPLFDTPSFTKHIESAYQEAYERYQNGLPIDHIHINHKID
ncbi:Spy Predicted O-linked N-acetylglucosamine transferase, SPINDLY family [Burkholderiales bacterium]